MSEPLVIDYYSDVLCVWAWIAQRRVDELNQELGDRIQLRYRYVDVFGDVATKMDVSWGERGHFEGFAAHVREAASNFDDAFVADNIWQETRPTSSAPAHIVLKAAERVAGSDASAKLAFAIRQAFYRDTRNVSQLSVLLAVCEEQGISPEAIQTTFEDGTAMADLMRDYRAAKDQMIKGSPCYVMDGGRQTLFGNVGYRVLKANIIELLDRPADIASWC